MPPLERKVTTTRISKVLSRFPTFIGTILSALGEHGSSDEGNSESGSDEDGDEAEDSESDEDEEGTDADDEEGTDTEVRISALAYLLQASFCNYLF